MCTQSLARSPKLRNCWRPARKHAVPLRCRDGRPHHHQHPERAAVLLGEVNRKTLGGLLRSPGLSTLTAAGVVNLFAEALKERNRLNHGFYRERNFRRNFPAGRAVMFEDLERIHGALLEAYRAAMLLSGADISKPSGHTPTEYLPI
jgi:hypothetical protein